MFDKMLALLPYNPSFMHQLSFYGKRMRQESIIRRAGLLFIVLAFLVQFFAVISPPVATLADSPNDLVNGGFSSAAEAASDCSSNVGAANGQLGYGTILANYGITCAEVASSPTVSLASNSYGNQLFSMGRLPYNIAGETPVTIDGSTLYFRYLNGWGYDVYSALKVTTTTGATYFLMYPCGNLVSIGLPRPPALTVQKAALAGYPANNSSVEEGNTLGYQINVSNSGGTAENVVLTDHLPTNTTYVSLTAGGANSAKYDTSSRTITWEWSEVPSNQNYAVQVKTQINTDAPSNSQICNDAVVSGLGVSPITSNQVCQTVKPPVVVKIPNCPYPGSGAILKSSPQCTPCQYNDELWSLSPQCKPPVCKYNDKIPASSSACKPPVKPCQYDKNIAASSPQCKPPVCKYNNKILASSSNCKPPVCKYNDKISASSSACKPPVKPCQYDSGLPASSPQCVPCTASLSTENPFACVAIHKTAADLTQGITNADGATAQPSDLISYTLYAQNNGKATVTNYIFQDNLSYVLDYATVNNLYSGKIDSSGDVSWPAVSIKAGQTVTEKFTVQVKNPVPQTPTSSSDPEYYNLVMSNTYGNSVNINVPGSPAKTIETAAAVLPNTGPGTSVFVGAIIVMIAGYFFGRSRLLARESAIAVDINVNGGQ